jgi:hypothetical protein
MPPNYHVLSSIISEYPSTDSLYSSLEGSNSGGSSSIPTSLLLSTKAAHKSLGNIEHKRCKCAVKLGGHAEDHYKYTLHALQGNYKARIVFSEVSGLLP